MKNLSKIFGIIAVAAVIMFSMTACPEDNNGGGTAPENLPDKGRWWAWVDPDSTATLDLSVNDDGVCTMIVGGVVDPDIWHAEGKYNFTAKANTSYTYNFEAWTDTGNRALSVSYYDHAWDDHGSAGGKNFSINSTPEAFTFIGPRITKAGVHTFEFNCANQLGKFYVKILSITETPSGSELPENWPAADRWNKFVDSSSTATLDQFSVSADGVVTITIGGTPEPNGQNNVWRAWTIQAQYTYTSRANARYIYEIEAWKAPGSEDRTLHFQYYEDNDARIYLGTNIMLTEERTTYTVKGEKLPNARGQLDFHCADQIGTFYVKVLSIEEYEQGELTITNFSGDPGLTAGSSVSGDAYYTDDEELYFGNVVELENESLTIWTVYVTGSSITLNVFIVNWETYTVTPFTGNVTIAAGDLSIRGSKEIGGEWIIQYYTNKVPITFKNGNATINFGTQMESSWGGGDPPDENGEEEVDP